MQKPTLGERCYFFRHGFVHLDDIIQIEECGYFLEEGILVNIQSETTSDLWIGYYLTFSTKEEALNYQKQQTEELYSLLRGRTNGKTK